MSTIHMSIVEQKNSSQNLKNLFSMTLEVQFIFINKFNFSFRQNFFKFGNPYCKTLALGSLDFSGFFSGTYVPPWHRLTWWLMCRAARPAWLRRLVRRPGEFHFRYYARFKYSVSQQNMTFKPNLEFPKSFTNDES